ncbi:MAG: LuxR C-terminal-related transcriptional regulator [Scytonema sp. PMC 1069.18]|nr:LuxR C-terminal-related transcriptional regulator [Scytonema sp. PMC 1069.18]MEC4881082.1 LuxR C-terminal-related transcriptional regulator [Scytonema sp. PMC 1070.18]
MNISIKADAEGIAMKEPQEEFPQTERIEINSVPKIVGEFYLRNYHFLVIHLDNKADNSTEANLTAVSQISSLPENIHFTVNGELCAIIRAENYETLDTKPDISLLLTQRELQIVKLVALGKPNKQIASQLCISEWTVSTHLRRIFAKLSVDSRAAMVHRCASLLS